MAKPEKKLFLLDAFALIYRAYYAFIKNPRINSKGLNTSAIFGFTNTLLDVINNEKPSHLAVVFDSITPTERHLDFEEYKANREEMPEDIAKSLPYIEKLLQAFNIPVLQSDGYEADDVIGTLAKQAEKKGFETFMMTPDKDFGQLITEHTVMYKPARSGKKAEVWGIKEICEKFEIEQPEQVIDILGLMGDSVDNIPGIPGVGEKTAKKLIKEFGSVEKLLENTDQLKGKLKEKVEENEEKAIISKKLATILTDAPVELDEEKLIIEEVNKDAVRELFKELEFRQLGKRVLNEELKIDFAQKPNPGGQMDLFSSNDEQSPEKENSAHFKTLEDTQHDYQLIRDKKGRTQLLKELEKQAAVCFDTETTGMNPHEAELVGISFSWKPKEAFYVPFPEDQEKAKSLIQEFEAFFKNEKVVKVGQNIKYDISVLKWYGVEVQGPLFDTMVAHYLIHPDMTRRNMDVLAETYLNYKPLPITSLIGKKGKNQKSMRDVPVEKACEYACEDADITLQLKKVFEKQLKESNAQQLFDEIETPLIPVLSEMEKEGIKLDKAALKTLSNDLKKDILEVEKEVHELGGESFNISSPKQVGEVLFKKLKVVDKPKKTKSGQFATGEDVLKKIENKHPIVKKILDYRELVKLKNTYVDPLPDLINPKTGRIHTSYNQIVAATGRLSSDKPNLQNIPIRTERGKLIRKAFVPRDDDHILFAADYSQIELRIIAELSGDEGMLEAFKSNTDIHAATASKVYDVKLEEVTSEMRRNAKMVNFGIIYGISAYGLSQRLDIPRKEAKQIIDQYFEKYPKVKEYMDKSIETAKEKGYVETIKGRRRYLRDINSRNAVVRGHAERNAINAPIQGSAADMIKIAMINIYKKLKQEKLQSRMILQVHDELVFDVLKKELDQIQPVVRELMRTAIPLSVPIEVEAGTGQNWLEAH